MAIAYLRLSPTPEERLSIDRQTEDVKALAGRLDTVLTDIFVDDQVSAFTARKETTAWGRALVAIERDRPDYLLVYKQDRIGRRLSDIEGLEELCKRTGTRVHAYEGGDVFANPAWPMLAAVAKMESQNTSIRVRRAQRQRREKGLPSNGGIRPYGYAPDRVTVIRHEADVLRKVAARVISGASLWGESDRLNAAGEPTVRGKRWTVTGLRQILRNPRYVGDLTRGPRGAREVVGAGSWEPVLDRQTWEALQAALGSVQREAMGKPAASLLSGIARCGVCLTPMVAGGEEGRRVYRCNRVVGGCGRVSRNRQRLDDYVVSQLLTEHTDSILREEAEEARAMVKSLSRELREIQWKIDDARTAHGEGRLDGREFYPLYDRLRVERERSTRHLGEAQTTAMRAGTLKDARRKWEYWTLSQRRNWVRQRVVTVVVRQAGRGRATIDPSTITIESR